MRVLIYSVVVAVASSWALSSLVSADEGKECKAKVWVTTSGGGDHEVIITKLGENHETCAGKFGQANLMVVLADGSRGTSEETEDGNVIILRGVGERQPINLAATRGREADPNRGWLGVQIGSFVTSDDEGGETAGVRILNVVEGSPAEQAGLQRDDVVIEVDDEAIGGDLGVLVGLIGDAGKGSRIKFTVLRDGERRTMAATLGSRGDSKPLRWIFESSPDAIWRDKLRSKVQVLLRGDDNEWVLEDLLDSDYASGISSHILKFLPKSQGKTIEVTVTDGGTSISTTVIEDGNSISVQQTDDGEIVVTRSSADSDEETTVIYSDEEELAAADEEAFQVYKDSSNHVVIGLKGGHDGPHLDFNFDFDTDAIQDSIDDVLKQFDIQLNDWAMDFEDLREHLSKLSLDVPGRVLRMHTREARRSIHENADGTMDVIIRKGDNELITHYSSAEDLKARDPDSYDSYMDLLEIDEDE